jgi:hypothetical protein
MKFTSVISSPALYLTRLISNASFKVKKYLITRDYTNYYNQLTKELLQKYGDTDDVKGIIQPLIKNQLNADLVKIECCDTLKLPEARPSKESEDCRRLVARCVIEAYLDVRNIVSIQPMLGPCALAFFMRTTGNKVSVEKVALEAKSRKFQFGMSMEAVRDIQALHNISDVFKDVMSPIIWSEIRAEMIASILDEIGKNAVSEEVRDPNAYGDHIVKAILDDKHQLGRHRNNFVVVDINGFASLLNHRKFHEVDHTNVDVFGLVGFIKINGTESVNVYLSTSPGYSGTLIGYKGSSAIDSTIIVAPYVPISDVFQGVCTNSFQPSVRYTTRYGAASVSEVPTFTKITLVESE